MKLMNISKYTTAAALMLAAGGLALATGCEAETPEEQLEDRVEENLDERGEALQDAEVDVERVPVAPGTVAPDATVDPMTPGMGLEDADDVEVE